MSGGVDLPRIWRLAQAMRSARSGREKNPASAGPEPDMLAFRRKKCKDVVNRRIRSDLALSVAGHDERRQENRENTTRKSQRDPVRDTGEFGTFAATVAGGEESQNESADRRLKISPEGTRLERKIRAFARPAGDARRDAGKFLNIG